MIGGLKAGNESAYANLFDEYYRPLSVFATKYVQDLETAKEIVQELFVNIYENRQSFQISTSIKSYLYQSVRNRCINHIKHKEVERKHRQLVISDKEPSEDLESMIYSIELEDKIFRVISKLQPQCQNIFKLSRVRGLKNKEISHKLQISIRTVETQISKALKELRKNLGADLIL